MMMIIIMMIKNVSRVIMYDEADDFIARKKYVDIEDDDGDTLYVRSSKEFIRTQIKTTEVVITGHQYMYNMKTVAAMKQAN